MQSLALPRPTALLATPFGRLSEPEDGLIKLRSKFSPSVTEQQSYPSPPMSEPHSPSRRTAQTSEPGLLYSAPASAPQRLEPSLPLPSPTSGLYHTRQPVASQSNPYPRQLYSGEPQPRRQSSQYHPGHSVEHSPYTPVQVQQNYAHGYSPAAVPAYGMGHHGGTMMQQAAMIAPPPSRPTKPARRTKAHVASACVNCKKAHLSCDVQRPCGRCVASGKQDTCKDVQHKKRGRPRLRDDRDFSRPEEARQQSGQLLGMVPASVAETYRTQGTYAPSHQPRVSDPPRPIGRMLEEHSSAIISPPGSSSNSAQQSRFGATAAAAASPYAAGPNLAYQTLPTAFLNLDLVIQKSNQAFQDLVSFLGDVSGRHLADLLEPRQSESLQRLRNELRDERDERDPTYMAPITPGGQDPLRPAIDILVDRDVEHVSQGFTDRPMFLSFRLANNAQYQSLQVQIRLAKTSLYFVTLVVRSPPRLPGPPLQTQQLAPPASIRTSQTMSAPTAAPVRDYTPHQARPPSSTSSAPSSPYFNFSSVRTSLPTFTPSSYSSSPSYGYSPNPGVESGYFPTMQPPSSSSGPIYPSPYAASPRNPPLAPEPVRERNPPARLEGLHLPPIRTGPAPLGSPLQIEGHSATERERNLVRRRVSSPSNEERGPETPETGKRRRLNIYEVLE